ncbi:ABC transporter substrate-binding protein [Terrihabitans rhizophilus]|uniref:ABC transporter substrate-binding protein n=1 Tax=Terrihabitans rhizophilus TaxID=3092662 RepID=A0ABU4RQ41_9HYPH|nr:ABC transporter substrate-binding protein [Terrihabitans sp. PJ23]MDX6806942.1 ABC transporter substrate-binding protein [Terrihabitans sp. PJ23]
MTGRKGLSRRDALALLGGAAASAFTASAGAAETPRLLLGDGHLLLALALVHPDPVSLLAGWQGDLALHSPQILDIYAERFPALRDVPRVGRASADTFSAELAIASGAELAIVGGCYGPGPQSTALIDRLQGAGMKVVFVDFFRDPLKNTADSMRRIGAVLGGDAVRKAEDFASFHEGRLRRISERLKTVGHRPSVMLQSMAGATGWTCCWVTGSAGLGRFVEFAGGTNIGAGLLRDLPWVQASKEYVLSHPIDLFVATGGPHLRGKAGLVAGPGVGDEEARATLKQAVAASGVAEIQAIQNGRVFGFWHLFHATPINIVALEALARWIHPDLFADLDPEATLAEINARFLAVPLPGRFTIAL